MPASGVGSAFVGERRRDMGEAIPTIRTSERVLFKRCQQAWWWAYREGLKPKARVSNALWFGELVHIALAAWYCGPGTKRGPEPAETFKRLATDELRMIKTSEPTEEEMAKYTDLRELGEILLGLYTEVYGRDDHKLIIQPEKTFSFDIPFPDYWGEATRKLLARYVGTVDNAWRHADTGQIWLDEHKTAASIREDHLPLDEQAGSYWAMIARSLRNEGLIGPKEDLAGITYNFIRKGLPDDRPRDAQGYACNKPVKADYASVLGYTGHEPEFKKMKLEELERLAAGYGKVVLGARSKMQPSPIFRRVPVYRTRAERTSLLLRVQTDAVQMEQARTGEIPLSKTPHWSCARMCAFFEMCRLHEASGNWRDFRSIAFRQEDPYGDHRKSTDEIGSFEL